MKGYVQIYTGNGKGKTTAALGLAVRALGNNWKVFLCQFMKGQDYGELRSLACFENLELKRFGRGVFLRNLENVTEEDQKLAREGYRIAKEALLSEKYPLVILDEIFVAHRFALISLEEILDLIVKKPEGVELVLTGRGVPEAVVEKADLVTEMKEIKHYFKVGVLARKGIER